MKRGFELSGMGAIALINPCLAQPCTPSWSTAFPGGDFDGSVRASVVFSDATGTSLYAAGSFTRAGGVHAQGVARWNGSAWSQVGGDFNGDVHVLYAHSDGALYAGGAFTAVGGLPQINKIARWNGTAWESLGPGSTGLGGGTVLAFVSFTEQGTTRLYAAGQYLSVNLQQAGVVRWNGNGFTIMNAGVGTRVVRALAVFNGPAGPQLFAAGSYLLTGTTGNIVRWDTNSWVLPSNGNDVNGAVNALAIFNDGLGPKLYAAGEFTQAGAAPASRIAKWDGQSWAALGTGVNGPVTALGIFDLDGFGGQAASLYAAGAFDQAGGGAANRLASWNGLAWSPVGAGVNGRVNTLTSYSITPALFVGGAFSQAGGITAANAASLTNSGWSTLANPNVGNAPSEGIRCQAWFDDDGPGPHPPKLFIGGEFASVGPTQANYIAAWDGHTWSALGQGLNAAPLAMQVYDDGTGPALFVGGKFTIAGGVPAGNVAKWNGSVWSALGAGLGGWVYDLEPYTPAAGPTRLIACGSFPSPPGGSSAGVGAWNGTSWSALGSPGFFFQGMLALASFDDGSGPRLFAAGQGISGSQISFTPCAVWNGSTWAHAGSGLFSSGYADALAVHDAGSGSQLYIGGSSLPANLQTEGVARWTGSSWAVMPGSPSGQVSALASFNDGSGPALYAGGPFTSLVGGAPAARLARWDGATWSAFGGGVELSATSLVTALTPAGASLFVGGSFASVGGVSSSNLAQWIGCGVCYANCDGSTTPPVLNVSDFSCFLNRFATGESYANCDGSTTPPVLNVSDFSCFLNRFGAGCP